MTKCQRSDHKASSSGFREHSCICSSISKVYLVPAFLLAHLFFPTFHFFAPARALKALKSQLAITRAGQIETFSKTDDLQVVRLVSYSLKKIYRMMSCNREVCIQSRRISSYDQQVSHATRVRLSCNQKGFLIARDGATPLPTLSYSKSKSWSPSLPQPRFSSQVQIALQIAISPLRSSRST